MPSFNTDRLWTIVIILLVVLVITGGIFVWSSYEPGDPVEIHRLPEKSWDGTIFIGGDVNLPGYYPYTYDDTVDTLLRAAGGVVNGSGPGEVSLILDDPTGKNPAQKIDINRAESWLLEALPGIGEILAQRIIDFRIKNDGFVNITELLEVEGIGISIYEKIAELITVSD